MNIKKWYFLKDDKKYFCRSSLESLFANWLIRNNIDFMFEPETFILDGKLKYTPDFLLIKENYYIEIKGTEERDYNQGKKRRLFSLSNKLIMYKEKDLSYLCGFDKEFRYYLYHSNKYYMSKEDFINVIFNSNIFDKNYFKLTSKFCTYCNSFFKLPQKGSRNEHWSWNKNGIKCLIRKREIHHKNYINTPKKYLKYIYQRIKYRCSSPNIRQKSYLGRLKISKEDFFTWGYPSLLSFMEENNITELYNSKISIDRIRNEEGYTKDNIQWLFLKDNLKKQAETKKIKVGQYSLDGVLIKIWDYITEVKLSGFSPGSVCACCSGDYKQHLGYKWKYLK